MGGCIMSRNKSFIVNEDTFENKMTLEIRCPICGTHSFVHDVQVMNYHQWEKGSTIQSVFPRMSVIDRELLITGMCAKCQDNFYSQFAED